MASDHFPRIRCLRNIFLFLVQLAPCTAPYGRPPCATVTPRIFNFFCHRHSCILLTHTVCPQGEDLMTVQDGSVMCLPTCSGGTACPAFGGHAQPSCVLNDGMGDQLCGLVCGSDSDCDFDGGAKCEAVQGESGPVNLCVYGWKSFWAWHVLQAAYNGAANKNLGDEK